MLELLSLFQGAVWTPNHFSPLEIMGSELLYNNIDITYNIERHWFDLEFVGLAMKQKYILKCFLSLLWQRTMYVHVYNCVCLPIIIWCCSCIWLFVTDKWYSIASQNGDMDAAATWCCQKSTSLASLETVGNVSWPWEITRSKTTPQCHWLQDNKTCMHHR